MPSSQRKTVSPLRNNAPQEASADSPDCADVGLTRTPGRTELLYPRSRLVTAAKAFGLQAIDLVCTQYKSPDVLREESEEGKRLGFDGKVSLSLCSHCSATPARKPTWRSTTIVSGLLLLGLNGTHASHTWS